MDAHHELPGGVLEEGDRHRTIHVDHHCPPDVPRDNYRYYLRVKKRALGVEDGRP